VHLTSSPRRVLGLLAAGTIGLSTALLGVTAVAHAAPGDETSASQPELAAALSVPTAPRELGVYRVGDGSVTVDFLTGYYDPAVEAETTGYEISTNNGSTWGALVVEAPYGNNERVGTVSGLSNKQSYTIVVRATSTAGPSGASNPVTAVPAKPIGAPVGLTVTTAPGKVTASWSAPTDAGSYAVGSYDVGLFQPAGPDGGGMGGQLCQTTAAVFTCTGDADFGTEWQVSVTAIDTEGNRGVSSAPVATGAIPFPATVPASNGPLTPAAGTTDKVVAGKPMTFSGTGYMPGSTVTVLIYSEPQVLTTVVADPSGNFTVTVTVPAGLAAGQHTLVAAGVDTLGNDRFMTLAVTVSAGGVATLAYTGTDVTVPAIAGLAAVAVGAGLIVASRRRRDAA
jgi:LPXTG-motif cell wall-anchored protein